MITGSFGVRHACPEPAPVVHAGNVQERWPAELNIFNLGLRDYTETWRAMQRMVDDRGADAPDQLWLTEHPSVFTLGLNGKREHLLDPGAIPVIHCDRGGQVTYHGPGQLIVYLLLDIKRRNLGVRFLVDSIQNALVSFLAQMGVLGETRAKAPGIYVAGAKIACLGLRIRDGKTYHGLSLNVDCDLEPFSRINPCGYSGLRVTRLKALGVNLSCAQAGKLLAAELSQCLGYSALAWGAAVEASA
jgi:lipoyl(octanoyl) transferase